MRIDGAIQVRSNVDPIFYSLVGSEFFPLYDFLVRLIIFYQNTV